MLEIIGDEVRRALALLGVTAIRQFALAHLHAAPPVVPPGVRSAFPHQHLDDGY